ncbi:MAG: hypothetical protein K2L00_07665, partial [Muribaculaceae bacterium]|nr:hypothetical protein [Muribaculaceae bacterium]
NEVKASIEESVLADIQVNAHWANEAKTRIEVTATAIFLEDKEDAGYKIGFLLISDGLSGIGSGWIQSNYFTGQQGYNGTELEVLTAWPSKVANLVFNDVVVDTDGLKGVPGSIPDNVVYNESYTTSFGYDIARNGIIQDKDKLTVAAFIINPDGTILNANKVKVGNTSAVDMLDSEAVEVNAEYYDVSGSRISGPHDGVCIKVMKMSDGSLRTQKIVNKF